MRICNVKFEHFIFYRSHIASKFHWVLYPKKYASHEAIFCNRPQWNESKDDISEPRRLAETIPISFWNICASFCDRKFIPVSITDSSCRIGLVNIYKSYHACYLYNVWRTCWQHWDCEVTHLWKLIFYCYCESPLISMYLA